MTKLDYWTDILENEISKNYNTKFLYIFIKKYAKFDEISIYTLILTVLIVIFLPFVVHAFNARKKKSDWSQKMW